MNRLLAILVAALVASGCFTALAQADGDPASDYLLTQQLFMVPESLKAPKASETALTQLVRSANEHGFKIRVAVIAGEYDLGSITELWGKPQIYARFLGIELSLAYKGPLLVAMPQGLGFYWEHHSTSTEYKTLEKIPLGKGVGELRAAQSAVSDLASAAGVNLAANPAKATPAASGGGGKSALVFILIGAAALAMLFAFALRLVELRRRRRSLPSGARADGKRAPAGPVVSAAMPSLAGAGGSIGADAGLAPATRPARDRGSRGSRAWLRLALPAFALLILFAGGAVVLALSKGGTVASHGTGVQRAAVVGTPFTWPAGKRPAPEFHLTAQNGKPISLAAYRGHPVIVTFIDPTCRDLCPLEAKVLNELDRKMPPAQRPAIVAVSVDPYAESHSDLVEDFSRWSLVPQWHWAIGKAAKLEAVWKHYYAEVEIKTKTIAGVTAHFVSHSEMAYLIDGKGDERALFSWPFTAKNVEQALSKITRS